MRYGCSDISITLWFVFYDTERLINILVVVRGGREAGYTEESIYWCFNNYATNAFLVLFGVLGFI